MEDELRQLGLTSNEVKVYLALLRLKSALAGQITEMAGVHRRNVYDALERLIQKGIVSYVYGRKRKYFKAEPPERLLGLLDAKKKSLSDIMPHLLEIFREHKTSVDVRVYSGKQGLKNIFEDQLRSKTEILIFGKSIRNMPELKYYFEQHRRSRIEKKIKVRAIFEESARKTQAAKLPMSKIKYIPDETAGLTSTNIYGNKVAIILMLETPTIILIENEKLHEAYVNYFEILWRGAS